MTDPIPLYSALLAILVLLTFTGFFVYLLHISERSWCGWPLRILALGAMAWVFAWAIATGKL